MLKITVCIGSSCHIKGSRQVVEGLQYLIAENNLGDKVDLGGTFCMGKCQQGVCVTVNDSFYSVTPETVGEFFEKEMNLEGVTLDETYVNSIEKDKELKEVLVNKVVELINNKKEEYGEELMGRIVNNILLSSIDRNWPAQITRMDHLKSGVNLRSYEGKNPITLYKNEAYKLFDDMFTDISKQTILSLLHVQMNIQPITVDEEIDEEM